jgi:ceramide glucosyltransferase
MGASLIFFPIPAACARGNGAWTMAALMHLSILRLLAVISGGATVASMLYGFVCLRAAARFLGRSFDRAHSGDWPGLSVLKPLKGADPELYEALRSHCLQDYPQYEILFGITEASDPAAIVVRKLIEEFPERTLKVVTCDQRLGANGKVSTLAQLAPWASHEILLVNDSDIRVTPDYLRTIAGELQPPATGMVTCLYRGLAAPTLASRLEALNISTDFVPGVLAASLIERGLDFGLGSTLAFRRRQLQAIGGFEAILDYLADDYELGHRIRRQGLKVELSRTIVETHIPAYDLAQFVSHQLRWARTIRTSRPGGYLGLLLTFTLPWAVAALIFARGSSWAWFLFAAALLVRMCVAFTTCRFVLEDRKTLHSLGLLPLRDFVAVLVWIGGLVGNHVVWRGKKFSLECGKLRPL